ncbi:conserved hypothetical protein [Tenacibaculum sp. 190524A02b]|uniref:Secreted protein n=1 Tax=Tenacibaculum vairaonense TaxID=3137860 RepID=A0ABM9PS33_9FLAO
MKKLIALIFVASLTFVSCTDNTQEHEELSKEISAIEKDQVTAPGSGTDDEDGSED